MATGTTTNSDVIIYNDLAQTSYLERLQDVIDVFNTASGGCITLNNELIEGDMRKRAIYQFNVPMAWRDVGSTSAAAVQKVGMGEITSIKVPFKIGPVQATEESFKRRLRSTEEFSEVVGIAAADGVLQGYTQYAIAMAKAAIGGNANVLLTGKTISTDGKKVLTGLLRKFGDRAQRIGLWVMNSGTYFDIVDNAIDTKLFNEADTVIYGGQPGTMGRPVLVTDQIDATTILGLTPGAIEVTESQAPGFQAYPVYGNENLTVAWRSEGAFNLGINGYSWKTASGVNPNLAAIGTAANWVKYATSDKATAGVMATLGAGS